MKHSNAAGIRDADQTPSAHIHGFSRRSGIRGDRWGHRSPRHSLPASAAFIWNPMEPCLSLLPPEPRPAPFSPGKSPDQPRSAPARAPTSPVQPRPAPASPGQPRPLPASRRGATLLSGWLWEAVRRTETTEIPPQRTEPPALHRGAAAVVVLLFQQRLLFSCSSSGSVVVLLFQQQPRSHPTHDRLRVSGARTTSVKTENLHTVSDQDLCSRLAGAGRQRTPRQTTGGERTNSTRS
ncbi:unnamed protein product [Menidia menidia]|uniref:(Atlantic silverside) hypothetical protein n=1 Tax=Menidia menidia TaxID=238744 RepID=A0A8S4AN87_9TELE|nr:unnamed protein product [Menidia menidia]